MSAELRFDNERKQSKVGRKRINILKSFAKKKGFGLTCIKHMANFTNLQFLKVY